jgi:hypothetical protein
VLLGRLGSQEHSCFWGGPRRRTGGFGAVVRSQHSRCFGHVLYRVDRAAGHAAAQGVPTFALLDLYSGCFGPRSTTSDVPPDVVPLPMLGFEAPAVQEVGAF